MLFRSPGETYANVEPLDLYAVLERAGFVDVVVDGDVVADGHVVAHEHGVADEHGIAIYEDAAQAHGASFRGPDNKWKTVGGIGDAGCFSFYPTKVLGAMGEGGGVVTSNKNLFEKFDTVYNTLSAMLSGTEPSFGQMKSLPLLLIEQ